MRKHTHSLYGNFMGGDPRRFSCDTESQIPEEAEAYKRDCEAWERGEGHDQGGSCNHGALVDEKTGKVTGSVIVCRSSYGLGVNTWDCDDPNCPEAQEEAA